MIDPAAKQEWHNKGEVPDLLHFIIRAVYGPDYGYGDGHHISVVRCGLEGRILTLREWPSVETMIFDPWFLGEVGGDRWIELGNALIPLSSQRRLQEIIRWIKRKDDEYAKASQEISRPARSARRSNRK